MEMFHASGRLPGQPPAAYLVAVDPVRRSNATEPDTDRTNTVWAGLLCTAERATSRTEKKKEEQKKGRKKNLKVRVAAGGEEEDWRSGLEKRMGRIEAPPPYSAFDFLCCLTPRAESS